MPEIWFWQRILSPHMAGLAAALARQGHAVTYVVEQAMSADRARQGWQPPSLPGVTLRIANSDQAVREAVDAAAPGSIHICQGIRANGLIGQAQRLLARRVLRQWVVMETVDDSRPHGWVKRAVYRAHFLRWRRHLAGVLASGWCTADWVRARGVPAARVFPFAYFLPGALPGAAPTDADGSAFRVLFVGQFIELKRLGQLIDALAALAQRSAADFRLQVVGSGPLEASLREHGQRLLGERLQWIGSLPMDAARACMTRADVLVLPSRHDGWGAVVSEALMAGTPAIASDACGSAGVVRASGVGGVFPAGDVVALGELLGRAMAAGHVSAAQRQALAAWARCLGAEAGAKYLGQILKYSDGLAPQPVAPWHVLNERMKSCVD